MSLLSPLIAKASYPEGIEIILLVLFAFFSGYLNQSCFVHGRDEHIPDQYTAASILAVHYVLGFSIGQAFQIIIFGI